MKLGWAQRTLGELCQIRPPKSEAREKLAPNKLVSFAGMEDLGIGRKFLQAKHVRPLSTVDGSYTYFADGDVLLAKITPCFENGKLGIAGGLQNGIGFGSSKFVVFRPTPILDKEFLYYYLSRPEFRAEGEAQMGGAVGQQRVPKEFIESYPISLPTLGEQKRIVGILDKAFDAIATAKANTEKNLQNARAIFDSHLDSVFTRDGSVLKTLEEAVILECTLSYGIVQPGHESPGGVPVVRPTDLTNKMIHLDGLKRVAPKLAAAYRRTTLQGGELLLCVRGSTGVVSVASPELVGANVTRGIVPIRFNAAILTQDFGYHLMTSGAVQRQIREKTYGAALMQINIRDLRKIALPVPSLVEQNKIAAELDSLATETQRLESTYQQKLSALEALKKSLLHEAFSGQL